REQWGLRVRRTIPRRWWLRLPVFLLYSGSAGGVLFTLLLLVLTIAVPTLALDQSEDYFNSVGSYLERDANHNNALAVTLSALYAFDYCMLAVFLRNVLLAGRVKAGVTWVIALILAAVGIALPYPLMFFFLGEEARMSQIDPWTQISNPFSTIYTCLVERPRESFPTECVVFLSALAAVLSIGCAPWMLRQLDRFRPAEKGPLSVQT
ncbi:MAG: hypothetical protein ACRELF_22705, partial [Gemmataceae bacterium]